MTSQPLPLTDQAHALLARARNEAHRMGCPLSGPAHIVMCVTKIPRVAASYILEVVNIDADALGATIRENFADTDVLPSEDEWRVIEQARRDAARRGCAFVDTDDLLLAALGLAGPIVGRAFVRLGISLDDTLTTANAHIEEMLRRGREHVTRLRGSSTD